MTHQHADGAVSLGIAAAVREAHAQGDHRRVATLLVGSPIEAWFSLPPHELREVLAAIPPLTRTSNLVLIGLSTILSHSPPPETNPKTPQDAELHRGGKHFRLRMGGAPRAALRQVAGANLAARSLSSLFDTTGGLDAVLAVQSGITHMLAGDLHAALASFTRAQLNPPRTLSFLSRDAHVKAAMIHAQFGDAGLARTQLDAAARVPRTDSWAERGIDAHAEIADTLLLPAGADDAIARIEAVPLADVGELWPYYVHAVNTVYQRAGRHRDGASRIELLRSATPPREPGDGFPGSVFETVLAETAILSGDPATARTLLAQADPDLFTTRLVAALVDYAAGNPNRALRSLVSLQAATAGLRRSDIVRLCLIAAALHGLGDSDASAGVLRQLGDRYGELSPNERLLLPSVLWPLATEHLRGWAAPAGGTPGAEFPLAGEVLTARERDVLACLTAGHSREQIAAALFVSVNTVKTHQRSLFRKLGASSRTEALLEASRRGLI